MGYEAVTIAVVAGEASGDVLGAGVIHALRQYYPRAEFVGIGGEFMRQAGCLELFSIDQLSVMGIVEVIKKLPTILKIRRSILAFFKKNPPDVYIGIDAPDFNLPIEKRLKKQGVLTVHYCSPTVWAWRENRIHTIAKSVNLMLTLFPFEAAFYEKHHVPVRFVGHPLADILNADTPPSQLRSEYALPQKAVIVALMPGSRKGEIDKIAPAFIKAAKLCYQKRSDLIFVAPMINAVRAKQFHALVMKYAPHLPIKIFVGCSHEMIIAADFVLLASGTATLETLLLNRPMVVCYKVPWVNYLIGKCLIKIDRFALPNLLAQAHLVPELIQKECQPQSIAQVVLEQLTQLPMPQELAQNYQRIRQGLTRNANQHAAQAIGQLLDLKLHGNQTIEV